MAVRCNNNVVRNVQSTLLPDVTFDGRLTRFWEVSLVMLVLYAHDASEYLYIRSVASLSNISRNSAAWVSTADWAETAEHTTSSAVRILIVADIFSSVRTHWLTVADTCCAVIEFQQSSLLPWPLDSRAIIWGCSLVSIYRLDLLLLYWTSLCCII